jgi:predicted NBD/HSP70 family sugar kinase
MYYCNILKTKNDIIRYYYIMSKSFFHIEKTLSPQFQNQINISIVFNYLREKGPISRTKISKDVGLSAPAVSRVINFLEKNGYIVEAGQEKTSVGKRPTLLKISSEGYVIGVDIGKRKIKAALANFFGDFIYTADGFDTPSNIEVDDKKFTKDLIGFIKQIIRKAEKKNLLKAKTLKAICFAVSAPVLLKTRKIVDIPLYGNYRKIHFEEVFKEEFGVPVFIENDVNCSAICENKLIEDEDIKNMVFIEISRGIGSSIIIDNKLFSGADGTSGEIGNSIINTSNLDFKIKNKGFLEKYASVEGIKKEAIRRINNGSKTLISNIKEQNKGYVEAEDIFLAALKKDKLAKDVINNAVDMLAVAILNLILIVNPQLIVIGGDICSLPEAEFLFLNPIISKITSAYPFKIPEIRFSLGGNEAGVCGASIIAIESLVLKDFPFKIKL